jgi:hypothetical protein
MASPLWNVVSAVTVDAQQNAAAEMPRLRVGVL